MANKCAILISHKNQAEYIRYILSALTVQEPFGIGDTPVLICDDNSTNEEYSLLIEHAIEFSKQIDVYVIKSPKSRQECWGKGRVLNCGVRHVGVLDKTIDTLLFLDGDCVPSRSWYQNYADAFVTVGDIKGKKFVVFDPSIPGLRSVEYKVSAEHADYNGLILVGPRFFIPEELLPQAYNLINKHKIGDLYVLTRGTVLWCTKSCYGVGYARMQGCNFAVRKSDFDAINGFREGPEGGGSLDDSYLYYDLIQRQKCVPVSSMNTAVFHFGDKKYYEWGVEGINP